MATRLHLVMIPVATRVHLVMEQAEFSKLKTRCHGRIKKLRPGLLVPGGAHWPKSGNRSPLDLSSDHHLVETVRLTATTLPLVCFLADASGVGAGATVEDSQALQPAAPQAGSAPQPGSQQLALQSGSQQLDLLQRLFFAWWIAFSRSTIRCFFLQQPFAAPQLGSQQPAPASQAGSQQPLPAPQAGSAQPLPAPQAGSAQPLPAPHAGSQQLSVQPRDFFLQANRPFRPPKRSCFFLQQPFAAPQLGSQQLDPASQAGSAQPLPAPQAGSAHPLPAPQPGSQHPLPASQPGSQQEAQPLWPSILSRSSKPND